MPLLEQLNPSIQGALIRLAKNATQDSEFIRERSDEVWHDVARLKRSADGEVLILDTRRLVAEHPAIQSAVFRRGIGTVGGESDSAAYPGYMMRLLGGGPGKTLDLPGQLTFSTDYGKALIGSADAVGAMLSTLPAMQGEYAVAVPGDTEAGVWLVLASVRHYGDGSAVMDAYREESGGRSGHPGKSTTGDAMDLDRVGGGLADTRTATGRQVSAAWDGAVEVAAGVHDRRPDSPEMARWAAIVGVRAGHRVRTRVAHRALGTGYGRDKARAASSASLTTRLRTLLTRKDLHDAVEARAGSYAGHLAATSGRACRLSRKSLR